MSWNYRLIEFTRNGETWRAIHEVFYDEAGKPNGYSETEAGVSWFVEEGTETGAEILRKMRDALVKPLLTEADFA